MNNPMHTIGKSRRFYWSSGSTDVPPGLYLWRSKHGVVRIVPSPGWLGRLVGRRIGKK